MGWQWHQLDRMQIICTLLQTDNPTPVAHQSVFTGWMPLLLPNQQRQSTEGCNVKLGSSRSVVADTMKCTVIPMFTLTGPVSLYSHTEVLHLSIKTANGQIRFAWKMAAELASVRSLSTSDWYQLVITGFVAYFLQAGPNKQPNRLETLTATVVYVTVAKCLTYK